MLDTSRTNQVTGTITSGVWLHNLKEISLRHKICLMSVNWVYFGRQKWHVNLMLLHKIKSAHIYLSSNDYFLSTSNQLNSTDTTKQRIWFLSHLIDRENWCKLCFACFLNLYIATQAKRMCISTEKFNIFFHVQVEPI